MRYDPYTGREYEFISILNLSSQVSLVWTSTLSSLDPAVELPKERESKEELETSKRSLKTKPSTGSSKSTKVLSLTKNLLSVFFYILF